MSTPVDKLKTKIKIFKRKITNLATFIDGYSAERDFPSLEKRITDLDREFEEFNTAYTELEELSEYLNFGITRTDYEEKFYVAFGKAKAFLNERSSNDPRPSSSQSIVRNDQANNFQTSKRNLPRLNVPFFIGSCESWLGFHDILKSLVDDDKDLHAIEKFYHLKGCLKDEAAKIIASLELSSENYVVAWELLKERYDNRKIIRQTHVKALLNLPYMSKGFPVRSFVDQIQKHARGLKALEEPVDQWDTLLVEIIKQKSKKTPPIKK